MREPLPYVSVALLDVHERCHRALGKLIEHCGGFNADELDREIDGFGYPTIRLQLQHVIGAEQYWVGVLRGLMLVDEHDEEAESIEALGAFRAKVAGVTRDYLNGANAAELNTPRTMTTWGNKEVELTPAHVILRTQVHIFDHKGQIAAMSRILGRPIPAGFDFPLAKGSKPRQPGMPMTGLCGRAFSLALRPP